VKAQIGEVLKEINRIEDSIHEIDKSISETYQSQEELMKKPSDAHMLTFFPFYLKSRVDDLKIQHNLLGKSNERYTELLNELKQARGEVKVLDNMKERKKEEFVKKKNKKESEEIEDILNLRRLLKQSE